MIQLGLLAIAGFLRPRWLPIFLAAIAIGFLLPHFAFVNQKYGLLQSFGKFFSNVAPPNASGGHESPTTQLVARGAEVLSIGMWVVGALGAWLRRRQGRTVLALVLLAYSPAAALALQAYGQEGILRVYLFSLPWCAALVALALFLTTSASVVAETSTGNGAPRVLIRTRVTAESFARSAARALRMPAGPLAAGSLRFPLALAVALALFFPAFFGWDGFYRMPGPEVATTTSFQRTATPGPVYPAVDSFPFNDTARYNLFPVEGIFGSGSMLGAR